MLKYRLHTVVMLGILLCLISGLVFAQKAKPDPVGGAAFDYNRDRWQYEGPAAALKKDLDSPLYAARGPYSVGRTWFSVSQGTEMPLILVVWYPALAGAQASTLAVPDEYDFPDVEVMENSANWGAATRDAAPDSSGGPYPLVLFSTGAFTSPQQYTNPEEHLASYGFIVLTAANPDEAFWSSFIARPMAVPYEIDFAETLNRMDGSFKGLIDTLHIGVAGHSSGGYTALAAAGARLDLAWFESWCAGPAPHFACPELLGHQAEMLALTGLDAMPASLWPGWGDPRISAVVSQAVPGFVFGSSGLASVTIPVMIQFGTNDSVVPPEWAGSLTYASLSSTQKAQVVFENGNHVMFATGGEALEPDPVGWDMDHARDLMNHFTTAFLLDILKQDPAAHHALLPGAVSFPGIVYATTLK